MAELCELSMTRRLRVAWTNRARIAARQREATEVRLYLLYVLGVPREGEGHNYYVVVDSRLTHEAADRKRAMALSAGLPADTYVTKLLR